MKKITIVIILFCKIGTLLVMSASRYNEFEADKFSSDLGYNAELIGFLHSLLTMEEKPKGLFAIMGSSHPKTDDRIEKLENLQETA